MKKSKSSKSESANGANKSEPENFLIVGIGAAGGEPTQNLLELIRPELRLELRAALCQAAERKTDVEVANVKIKIDERPEVINIYLRPVLRQTDTERDFILVLFEKMRENAEETEIVHGSDEPLVRRLEEELARSQMRLRFLVEQYEAQAERHSTIWD